ncbi:DENN domain-containing protein Crag isoform X2 [Lycorma delicatula]|uniref:DENN domain-containing protein Crag isoform X2 n=1 Tax=Lycorma delicatula TaxID=130591 RepID=UPI003F512CCD
MDDRRVADYFVVAGLPDDLQPVDEFCKDGTYLKPSHNQAPITDITVIFPTLGETVPPEYEMIESTPTGFLADLNHGSLRSPEVYLCYRRGRDKPPLVDIGVMYEGKERILPDAEVVLTTPGGRPANVNNSTARTLLTYRRASETMPCNGLVVTDIVVIITSKQETPPHAFCMINKNLNKGLVGSDVYLCYKKSMNRVNLITYKPGILLRYPFVDRPNFPFPASVPLFCLPVGATLECWPATAQEPDAVFSTFVLTVSDAAEKVYGSAVTFYEKYPSEKLTPEQLKELDPGEEIMTYHVNKCICILSHWPFFDTFEKFLLFIYKMSCTGPHPVPIERYISHLLEEVPFPSLQRPRILLQLSLDTRLILTQPEDLPLPRSGAGFRQLLISLGPENCLLLLLCALTEQKLLVHSLRPDVLTAVAEAVAMIIFPFKWQCPYIPLCPLGLAEVLHAPLPFLIGVDSRFFDLYDPPTDVNCVDLDTNNITVCDDKRQLNVKLLPKKAARALRSNLERLYEKLIKFMETQIPNDKTADTNIDQDFQLKRREQSLELEIQEAFLRFMATVLKGYRSFLLPIIKAPTVGTTDTHSLFDLQGFLRSRDKTYNKFFSMVMKTQMFIRFIEERSFVSDMDAGLAFFDECIEKVENDDMDVHLIELDESHQSERTMFIVPPEQSGQPVVSHIYESFKLDPELFCIQKKETKGTPSCRVSSGGLAPGSPMARRTKHEIKSAQKLARKYAASPELWAKCLLGTCYSIWFIHLPSCILFSPSKAPATLRAAYELLLRIHKTGLTPTDEVCYRVMMQLCGVYSQPVLAVKLLFQMKRSGVQPNAITYGFYNRAVLEATWPSDMSNSSQLLWNKLRNVVLGAALFRQAGCRVANRRRLSTVTLDDSNLSFAADASVDGISIGSANSHESKSNTPALLTGSQQSDRGYATVDALEVKESDVIPVKIQTVETKSQQISKNNSSNSISTIQETFVTRDTRSHSAGVINSVDFAVQKFDRFRSRVGSIVRPSVYHPLLSPGQSLNQQASFESSAGLLMPGVGAALLEEGRDLFDADHIDSLVGQGGNTTLGPRRRNRSGSCTEFTTGGTTGIISNNSSHRLPHAHRLHTPTSPKPASRDADCFKLLTRSESFANDAGILAKLNTLKLEMSPNVGIQQQKNGNNNRRNSGTGGPLIGGHSSSKSLFAGVRRNSLTMRRLTERPNSESCTSSMENIGSGGCGGSSTGSCDDLDTSITNIAKYNSKIPSDIANNINNNNNNKIKVSNDLMWLHRRNSVGTINETPMKVSDEFLNKSPIKSPSRTPVTENDPLGALMVEQETGKVLLDKKTERISSVASDIVYDSSGAPVLFNRRKGEWDVNSNVGGGNFGSGNGGGGGVVRSATFHHPGDDETEDDEDDEEYEEEALNEIRKSKVLQRSSTMPIDAENISTLGNNTGPRGSIGSSFKLPSFTSTTLTSKKSNELLKGGLHSLKSAATSVAKKFDEFKEALSANSTPVRSSSRGGAGLSGMERDEEEESVEGEQDGPPVRRKISSEFSPLAVADNWSSFMGQNIMELFSDTSRKGSSSNLQPLGETSAWSSQQCLFPEKLYPKVTRDLNTPVALEISMTTCSKCHNCSSVLYDEEIMAGWVPEDSNLNTKCQFCDKATVPFLSVAVLDFRNSPMCTAGSRESLLSTDRLFPSSPLGRSSLSVNSSQGACTEDEPASFEPITVPYLNPLVLRKELESILYAEGDTCLTHSKFVDEHPIIYWNMVWIFQRINVSSHLPGLCLNSASVINNREKSSFHPSWANADHNNVVIRTLWDNPRLHEEVGQPMYVLWNQDDQQSSLVSALLTDRTTVSRSVMEKVLDSVRCNNLVDPMKRLATERQKLKGNGVNRGHSLYRDILFLAFTVVGRDNIDQSAFDREYVSAFEKLSDKESKMYQRSDQPLSIASLYCRAYFRELEL